MPLDDLPGIFITRSRDEIVARHKIDYANRVAGADTSDGTQEDVDARLIADTLAPIYSDAASIGNGISLDDARGARLKAWAKFAGVTPLELPAVGASGFVAASASATGGSILAGDEIRNLLTGFRYKCNASKVYADGEAVPVIGIDTGLETNVEPGAVLVWSNPRAGIGQLATVLTQTDGSGLSGGRGAETEDELRNRIREVRANPPASGNDSEYQTTGLSTAGIFLQQVFTYPAIKGSGSMGAVFTMRPARPGGSRIPNGAQIALVLANLVGQMPADDGIFLGTIVASPIKVAFKVTWAPGASSWADVAPWPPYYAPPTDGSSAVVVSAAVDATHFTLSGTTTVQPVVGQTIGLYDAAKGIFREKKILSFTGTGPWVITCDTANGASDATYVPIVGQRACPWSDSLDDVIGPTLAYFDSLGPGEQVATFFDAGLRWRRSPASPLSWPSVIANRDILGGLKIPSIEDVVAADPALPTTTPIGTPGVMSHLLTLSDLAAFPQ